MLPAGLSAAQVSEIGGLAGVRAVLAVDGGRVMINGRAASVLGVTPETFRSWTPPVTAAVGGDLGRAGRAGSSSRTGAPAARSA